jgi:citrate lyase subunit beta/citryl-CoA lyase
MPASNPRAIAKARQLWCDVVILDLEDAVAPHSKASAREIAVEAVRDGGFGSRELVVRVNALGTPWGDEDLAAIAAVSPDAILLPKVGSGEALHRAAASLQRHTKLWAMIETPEAIFNLADITCAAKMMPFGAFVTGTNDLAKEMRCILDTKRTALQPALFAIVAAARMNGFDVLDGVFNDISDHDGLAAQCRQGAEFGFTGKTLIHPSQVDIANSSFSPSEEDLAQARSVIEAFARPDVAELSVIQVNGRMVERLHLEQALQLVAVSDLICRQTGNFSCES